MKVFLAALFFSAISALGMSTLLEKIQRPSYAAFTTGGARISDPDNRRIDPVVARTESVGGPLASNSGAIKEQATVASAQGQEAKNIDRAELPSTSEVANHGSNPPAVHQPVVMATATNEKASDGQAAGRPEAVLAQAEVTGATPPVAQQPTEVTTRPPPSEKSSENADRSESAKTGETPKVAPPAPQDRLAALLIARLNIASASDLTSKTVAIDEQQSSLVATIRAAITTAGAAEIEMSASQRSAFGRLVRGEVPAALLTLDYPEAAEWLPEIAGFRVLRILLPSPKAQPDAASLSSARPVREQVAAAVAFADQATLAAEASAAKSEPASPNNDHLVALLLTHSDVKSLSDLNNKNVAIDKRQAASSANVRTAIVAAGALEVQLSEAEGTAFDRLTNGEVSAAIVTLAAPEAAEWFPEIKGFKVFKIPLSPLALKARL